MTRRCWDRGEIQGALSTGCERPVRELDSAAPQTKLKDAKAREWLVQWTEQGHP